MNSELATITDARTGEIIPAGATKEIVQPTYAVDYSRVGTIKVEPEQAAVLTEAVSDAEIKIRPDGNLYVSWSFYASRLNKAFGVLQWGLIPDGKPMSKPAAYDDVLVAWGHWLVIKGVPVGYAIGETTYKATNNMMSYADACEGAKSSSLARNCKIFGASFDLWDAEFCAEWRERCAEKYKDNGKDKWRKKSTPKVVTVTTTPTNAEPATVTPETPAQSLQGVNTKTTTQTATKPQPAVRYEEPQNTETRPYQPAIFKERFTLKVQQLEAGTPSPAFDSHRKIVAAAIDGIFNGESTMRYEVCEWLTGKSSTKNMSDNEIWALLKLMAVTGFNQAPSENSMIEFRAAHTEALKAKGQGDLFSDVPTVEGIPV